MNTAPNEIVVVHIVGSSYSGTTWLNLVLGSNPDAFSIGEMDHIAKLKRPLCVFEGDGCEVWSRFKLKSSENPFEQLARITGKRYLIVNNSRRFLKAMRPPHITVRTIGLWRDGRAILASGLRKRPYQSVAYISKSWKRTIRKKRRHLDRQPADSVKYMHYETLVSDRPRYVREICEFAGMAYDESMLEYWLQQHHFIGGGTALQAVAHQHGVKSMWYRTHENEVVEAPLADTKKESILPSREFYLKSDPKTFVDKRWMQELTDEQLSQFDRVAGRLNESLGYPPVLQRDSSVG